MFRFELCGCSTGDTLVKEHKIYGNEEIHEKNKGGRMKLICNYIRYTCYKLLNLMEHYSVTAEALELKSCRPGWNKREYMDQTFKIEVLLSSRLLGSVFFEVTCWAWDASRDHAIHHSLCWPAVSCHSVKGYTLTHFGIWVYRSHFKYWLFPFEAFRKQFLLEK